MPASGINPAIQQLLDRVAIKPRGDHRGQADIVGFASTAEQMDRVLSQCRNLAEKMQDVLSAQHGWTQDTAFVAGICPHDDYYYAGRLYSLVMPHIRAKRVILLGVFHKAKLFECNDRLVFDSYQTWSGPYGDIPVSSLRESIVKRLPATDYVIDNRMQMVELSVEAILPFLQAYDREVEIVPIIVPYMDWDTLDRLAGQVAIALIATCKENGWRLGHDLSLICSSDAVHYGDVGWGGANFAPFGAGIDGYNMAVSREIDLAEKYLCGSVSRQKLKEFLYQCVDSDDVTQYRIPWCGRFSIPFGLNVASRVTEALESRPLRGYLLDYGTSISEASLDVEGLDGLDSTAPNNLHHWVGYAAIGYL
jgi:AmmeMemoRadiSam system protein B